MMRRRTFLAACCGVSPPVFAGCGKSRSAGGSSALRVGMDLSYPPFEMQDKAGEPDGVSVRIAEALAADLGRPLRIAPMDFSGLIPALKTGNIDLVISSMTANDERRESIDFSEPYAFTGLALLVARESGVKSVEDLRKPGRVVSVKAATTGESWAAANLPQAKRVVFENPSSCVMEVVQGRADAFIYDQLSVFRYANENRETSRGLLEPFVEESWAVGIAKGNDGLRAGVNAFLTKFRGRGGLSELGDRYLADEKRFLEAAGIPFILR